METVSIRSPDRCRRLRSARGGARCVNRLYRSGPGGTALPRSYPGAGRSAGRRDGAGAPQPFLAPVTVLPRLERGAARLDRHGLVLRPEWLPDRRHSVRHPRAPRLLPLVLRPPVAAHPSPLLLRPRLPHLRGDALEGGRAVPTPRRGMGVARLVLRLSRQLHDGGRGRLADGGPRSQPVVVPPGRGAVLSPVSPRDPASASGHALPRAVGGGVPESGSAGRSVRAESRQPLLAVRAPALSHGRAGARCADRDPVSPG